jgi:predicted NUDIX family NTP pyrophosphohydrolase
MFRRRGIDIEVFLCHPGGPEWANRNLESWTIPKGEYSDDETALEAAQREFREETGFEPHGPYLPLGEQLQQSGKLLTAFAFEGDCDPARLVSNTCHIEWPPSSGIQIEIPEIESGRWFATSEATPLIRPGQVPYLVMLEKMLAL